MNHALWYATRATGVVALILLTITVALGIVGVSKLQSPKWPRLVTALLHKNIALLVTAFIGIHIATTLLDSFVNIDPVAALIPFTSSYRPFWLGLGAIAFDLILALIATSLLRSRMSYRAWRAVHILAYASWPIALWHGLGTGTDARLPWLLTLDGLCVLAVASALAWRARLMSPGTLRAAALTATVAVPIATAMFVIAGPLRAGWAVRAGTPPAVLGGQGNPTASTPGRWIKFAGHAVIATTPGSDHEVITVRASTAATDARDLTVVLAGTKDDGGIEMTAGSVRIVAVGGIPVWTGPVTSLNGPHVTAAVHHSGGATGQVWLSLVIDGHSASGRILLTPGRPAVGNGE
jgi:methionine sulfoxide reductase heme-binding subunit